MNQGNTLREIAQNYRFSYEDLVGTPDMPRSNCVTGGMSSFTSRKAGEARKK